MEEAIWEPESTMRAQYPQLFTPGNNLEDEIPLGGGGGGGGESCNTTNYTLEILYHV